MIQKVKPAISLKLVHSSTEAKNSLGGQSGEAYSNAESQNSAPADANNEASTDPTPEQNSAPASPPLDAAQIDHEVGLTQVLKDWIEKGKANGNPISAFKMTLRYQGESAPAKGMLLNKKIS